MEGAIFFPGSYRVIDPRVQILDFENFSKSLNMSAPDQPDKEPRNGSQAKCPNCSVLFDSCREGWTCRDCFLVFCGLTCLHEHQKEEDVDGEYDSSSGSSSSGEKDTTPDIPLIYDEHQQVGAKPTLIDFLKSCRHFDPDKSTEIHTLFYSTWKEYAVRSSIRNQIPVEYMLPPDFLCSYYLNMPEHITSGHRFRSGVTWSQNLCRLRGCKDWCYHTHSLGDWTEEVLMLKSEGFWFTYEIVADAEWCLRGERWTDIDGLGSQLIAGPVDYARLDVHVCKLIAKAASHTFSWRSHNCPRNAEYSPVEEEDREGLTINGSRIRDVMDSTLVAFTRNGSHYAKREHFCRFDELEMTASEKDPTLWLYPNMPDDFGGLGLLGDKTCAGPSGKAIVVKFNHFYDHVGHRYGNHPAKNSYRLEIPVVDIVKVELCKETGKRIISPHPHLESFSRKFLNFLESDQLTRTFGTLHLACNCLLCREAQDICASDHLLKTEGARSILVIMNSNKRKVKLPYNKK